MTQYIIYSDGGARGNPGEAGYGFIIKLEIRNPKSETMSKSKSSKFKTVAKEGKYIGIATNNQAEYQGVLAALKKIVEIFEVDKPEEQYKVICRLDSKLIVEQINGRYKVKNEGLKHFYWEIRELVIKLNNRVVFEHIAREYNKEADALVNEAIDNATRLQK